MRTQKTFHSNYNVNVMNGGHRGNENKRETIGFFLFQLKWQQFLEFKLFDFVQLDSKREVCGGDGGFLKRRYMVVVFSKGGTWW